MFTGLVQKSGEVVEVIAGEKGGRILIEAEPWGTPLEQGESIAVQGVCLTLVSCEDGRLAFDVLQETFDRTCLQQKKEGSLVNLERALRMGEPLGGHIVQGHVDGTGTIRSIDPIGRDWMISINCAQELLSDMVYKGSIALDGISLTIAALDDKGFTVHIIPHTFEVTSLQKAQPGDMVNLEADILAKHVRRMLETGSWSKGPSWDDLRQLGLS